MLSQRIFTFGMKQYSVFVCDLLFRLQTACGPVASKSSLTVPRQRVYRQTVTTLT